MVQNKSFDKFRILAVFMILSLLLGCNKVDYMVHIDTDSLRTDGVFVEDFESYKPFISNNILMVPDFTTLSGSYDPPASLIRFYSLEKSSIYVERIELSSESNTYLIKTIKRNFEINKSLNGVYFGILPLFNVDDVSKKDIETIWKKNEITLKLFYSTSSSNNLELKVFRLVLKSRRDFSWTT